MPHLDHFNTTRTGLVYPGKRRSIVAPEACTARMARHMSVAACEERIALEALIPYSL